MSQIYLKQIFQFAYKVNCFNLFLTLKELQQNLVKIHLTKHEKNYVFFFN